MKCNSGNLTLPVWVAKESTRFQYAETFSVVTTEAIRCYSCVSGIGGSGCEDEFDESGGGVTIIENDESTTDPCIACTKLKASAYGNMFSSSSEISFFTCSICSIHSVVWKTEQ